MELTVEMIPLIRSCRGLSQVEFCYYSGIGQARLSDLETGKIPFTKHYQQKISQAIRKLNLTDDELYHIDKLVQIRQ